MFLVQVGALLFCAFVKSDEVKSFVVLPFVGIWEYTVDAEKLLVIETVGFNRFAMDWTNSLTSRFQVETRLLRLVMINWVSYGSLWLVALCIEVYLLRMLRLGVIVCCIYEVHGVILEVDVFHNTDSALILKWSLDSFLNRVWINGCLGWNQAVTRFWLLIWRLSISFVPSWSSSFLLLLRVTVSLLLEWRLEHLGSWLETTFLLSVLGLMLILAGAILNCLAPLGILHLHLLLIHHLLSSINGLLIMIIHL
jgi:hypothetical protein